MQTSQLIGTDFLARPEQVGSAPLRLENVMSEWWRGGVIYQVYPRSFQDTDGDGVGVLAGIIHRLDYIQSLGVDCIWVSPIQQSPQADMGYDVSDYLEVDRLFGSL